jgi:hypothetical protein
LPDLLGVDDFARAVRRDGTGDRADYAGDFSVTMRRMEVAAEVNEGIISRQTREVSPARPEAHETSVNC